MRLVTAIYIFISYTNCSPSNNYGPFQLLVNKLDICNGPRNKNCTVITPTMAEGGMFSVNFEVTEDCHPSKAKIVALSKGRELIRLQMNKPCDHLFVRPLLDSLFTVKKNCVVLKGNYTCKLDMNEMTNSYFGGKFFYGDMTFKSVVYGDDCNFSCTVLRVTLRPR